MERSARFGRFRVAYEEHGDPAAPPVVLVHGLGSSRLCWRRNVADLATQHRVIALDLPGFGRSSKPRYAYSLSFFAEKVRQLLEELGAEDATWIGHSMGAQVAVRAALQQEPPAMVLVAPAGFEVFGDNARKTLEKNVTETWVRKQSPRVQRAHLELAFHEMPPDAEELLRFRQAFRGPELEGYAAAFSSSVRAMLREPVFDALQQLVCPVLVVAGGQDRLIPNATLSPGMSTRSVMESGVDQLLNGCLVTIPEAGHLVMYEKPEAFAEAVLPFLRDVAVAQNYVAPHHGAR